MNEPNYKELNGGNCREISIKIKYPEFWEYLNEHYPTNISFQEKIYWYFNGLTEKPKCQHPDCQNETFFINLKEGYRNYCSRKCLNSDPGKKEKVKNICLERYGGVAPACSKEIMNKMEQTNLKRYGVKNAMQNQELAEKSHKTNIERYGGCGNSSKILLEQYKKTNKEKFGSSNYMQSQIFYNKILKNHTDIISFDIINRIAICKCPDSNCNICTEKQYEINFSEYQSRLTNNIPLCTKQYHLHPKNIKGTYIELFIQNLLDDNGIEYETNVRNIISPQELDIYIPSKKIAIECNGVYYHNSESKTKVYHRNKYINCKNNGIQLLTIWEDWIQNKPEIVKAIILSKLGIYTERIPARKCSIKQIFPEESNELLNKYHIQGGCASQVRYGLYYQDRLVSVMTFSKKRNMIIGSNKSDDEWELVRLCTVGGIQVIGGAEKLLKHFIDDYKPKSVYSFSSNDISNGNAYSKLGFIETARNDSYWYIEPNTFKRYHRSSFTKQSIIEHGWKDSKDGWTESEVMKEHGYLQIYDSGQTKWGLTI